MIPASYPGVTVPQTAYQQVPSQEQHDLNPGFWDAYAKAWATGQNRQICPSASGFAYWWPYHVACINAALPQYDSLHFPIKNNDAIDAAMYDLSEWEWRFNPLSGENTVYPG
jgi:hypothetical protein